jgi:CRISPR-associated endonuclease/helicase Cas3
VVLNTVKRAKAVYEALLKARKKAVSPKLLLVHSRFRPQERERLNEQLQQGGEATKDRIIVATQVVEAGVDISARTLITELAPWASVVQRIGRCNRTGADSPGRVFWIDIDTDKQAAPYEAETLIFAREQLLKLKGKDVAPKSLEDFGRRENIVLPFDHVHVVRRRDVLDLFDTTPDLSGNDIDVSRFVRGDDPETDLQVFWRRWEGNAPQDDLTAPNRRELCSVPFLEFRDFLVKLREKKSHPAFIWDHIENEWARLDSRQTRPGLRVLLPCSAGGYSELGWDAGSTAEVEPATESSNQPEEATTSDPDSAGPPLTIAEHTNNVCDELALALHSLRRFLESWSGHLERAARWHDAGKAHEVFRKSLQVANPSLTTDKLWAKSGVSTPLRHERKYFRHELASALVALQHDLPFAVAYLIAAHHGKVRLSIRALPGECLPGSPDTLFALGVWDGELLPEVDLGGETCPETLLDLSPMRLGGPASWTAQALRLRDALGPFRLAYLESLLRAADLRASANERKKADHA